MADFNFLFLFLLFLSVSCAPIQIIEDQEGTSFSSQNPISETEGLFLDLDQFDDGLDVEPSRRPALQTKAFPMIHNSRVNYWLNYLSKGDGRKTMIKNLERLGRYGAYMGNILREEGLPPELVYVAMAESGFRSGARSSAKAVGYWQFIHQTAKRYDLKINKQVDERRDFNLATKAAAKYYKDLYEKFNDWPLSMAGYNCGENCVKEAIREQGSRDFWTLASRKSLPKETRNYVPKVIAMAHIGEKPSSYGFHNINYQSPLDYQLAELDKLDSGSHIHLSSLSKRHNIVLEDLKALNPKYTTDHVSSSSVYIRVPSSF